MEKKKIILCDTNIFIDLFHEEPRILQELDYLGFSRLAMSAVSVAEIYFGMRKRESVLTRDLVRKFNIYHLDKEISVRFLQLMLGYRDFGISVPDALIAATALVNNVELFTHNRKDFDFIDGLKLYKPQY
jgi:tRNA(fMet)-specific endonuclease VapC